MTEQKRKILSLLERNDVESVVSAVAADRKGISTLVRLSYDKDSLVGWRAIIAVGMAARDMAETDPEFLRDICRKLLWSLNDESGGIGWSAPELLGEIVSSDPKRFADIVPLVASAFGIEEHTFRAGVLYALSRIGELMPDQVSSYQNIMNEALIDADPLVRIRVLELIEKIYVRALSSGQWTTAYGDAVKRLIEKMYDDKRESWIYRGDGFTSIQVGEYAREVIKHL